MLANTEISVAINDALMTLQVILAQIFDGGLHARPSRISKAKIEATSQSSRLATGPHATEAATRDILIAADMEGPEPSFLHGASL